MSSTITPPKNLNIRILNNEARENELQVQREAEIKHYKRPTEHAFTSQQKGSTTILFGGFTIKHERLIKAALEGLGHRAEHIPTPTVSSFQLGKEFGNNGQCNPTYFTVGNLVKYLQNLEKSGICKQDILEKYVFVTAGSCGPCRFGMYESEYRIALRNSGFDGFRVLLFQQGEGIDQAAFEAGLDLNIEFFLLFLNALVIGDAINNLYYRIKPYEVISGETDRILDESLSKLEGKLKEIGAKSTVLSKKYEKAGTLKSFARYYKNYNLFIKDKSFDHLMKEIAAQFNTIKVDFLRVRPIVKIIGEFWAHTTEGDGNFNMHRFLLKENAHVFVETITAWVSYLVYNAKLRLKERRYLLSKEVKGIKRVFKWMSSFLQDIAYQRGLNFADRVILGKYNRLRKQMNDIIPALPNQAKLAKYAEGHYDQHSEGGEGHLEVAKNIYYTKESLTHMVLSLKPFGCMPSTQSDGAQVGTLSKVTDMIYLPIETSGEGEVNAHSRVQMALGEAKVKAKIEFKRVCEENNVTVEEVKDFLEKHPEYQQATRPFPHYKDRKIVGHAANYIQYIASIMNDKRASA